MSNGDLRRWAEALPMAEIFTLDDVQAYFPDKSRNALKMGLSRLCKGDDPVIARAFRGIYCRRLQGQLRLPFEVLEELPWIVAGAGAGLTGPAVINALGWSTQVSPRMWVATVGTPPKCPDDWGIIFQSRSNRNRLCLRRDEVSCLEAVRSFDIWAEKDWDEAMTSLNKRMQKVALPQRVRGDLFLQVADAERGQGPLFRERCRDVVDAAA